MGVIAPLPLTRQGGFLRPYLRSYRTQGLRVDSRQGLSDSAEVIGLYLPM